MKTIVNELLKGNLNCLTPDKVIEINSMTLNLLNKQTHSNYEKDLMNDILHISNILYNNTDRNFLPLEDGVYDLLLELYKSYDPNYQVGAEPVFFDTKGTIFEFPQKNIFVEHPSKQQLDEMIFGNTIYQNNLNKDMFRTNIFIHDKDEYNSISKRIVNSEQTHPNLVGTLDKCKFVMNYQAEEKGVINDNNVKILERDFFGKHIEDGILDPNKPIGICMELKYDGVSVVGDILNSMLVSASSRGDTNNNLAADLTPIFYGYPFNIPLHMSQEPIGVKFEAIMTYKNLEIYNNLKGKNYKNCRTAISGLINSSDAYKYRDLITLVPLACTIDTENNRIAEIELMNKLFAREQPLIYSYIYSNYTSALYSIKKFVEEAEFLRPYIPFMYDGIVISYTDKDIIEKLGRTNSVNKYSCAVKFNPLKKQTIFNGYSYTVGQDGKITPMIHYNPVEFFGTVHDKSSGHSYERFKNLNLRIGDIIDVEYMNDVMPYVTKPDNSHNRDNPNPIVEFITHCPSCNTLLDISKTGKTMICNNPNCPEKNLKRTVAMLDKLNIKDFSEAYITRINKFRLNELFNLTYDDVKCLGEVNSKKFIDRINELKTNEIYDYQIIGSLGFTSVALEKWKLILTHLSIEDLIQLHMNNMIELSLVNIKGIGPLTAKTIAEEFEFFLPDIVIISKMNNVKRSLGNIDKKVSIRFTGVRDKDLMEYLQELGFDASDKSVTKNTDILLIPYEGFTSNKTNKVGDKTQIIDIETFKSNLGKYLRNI